MRQARNRICVRGVVWCGVVWCGVVWKWAGGGGVFYVWCDMVLCDVCVMLPGQRQFRVVLIAPQTAQLCKVVYAVRF